MRNPWPVFPLSIKYISVVIFIAQVQNKIYISFSSSSNIFGSHLKLCCCSCCFVQDPYARLNLPIHPKLSFTPHEIQLASQSIHALQFLKCSSHRLPKFPTVKAVLLNDQTSHQQFYIILLVCSFITAYHYTIMEDNMSKNPWRRLSLTTTTNTMSQCNLLQYLMLYFYL